MNTPIVESRRTILACIALAGAVAIALLSLASVARGGDAKAQGAKTDALYPHSIKLTDGKTAHWAVLMRRTVVRAKPGLASRVITTLPTGTTDGTQNDVLVLSRIDLSPTSSWYWVRLPILPNNTTGFVRKRDLSPLFTVHTHLFINRGALTATLQRYGKVVFKTRVGVGKSYWPTPRGELRPRQADQLQQPVLRAARLRYQRPFGSVDRLARRWLRRNPRHERASADPGVYLARLHPHAQRLDPGAVAVDASGHARLDPLSDRQTSSTTLRGRLVATFRGIE